MSQESSTVADAHRNVANQRSHSAGHGMGRLGSQRPPAPVEAATWMIREVAHDIRSPLSGVQETLRLIRDGDVGRVNPEQKQFLADASDQCELISHLISEMADMTGDSIPRVRAYRRWESISTLVNAIENTTRALTRVRGVGLRMDVQVDQEKKVFVDRVALIRLISNLLVNAMRCSSEGQNVCLKVEMIAGQNEVLWTIADQGIGMSEEELNRVARRGVSLQQSSGLGLSICRRLSTMSHSPLRLRTRLGAGTQVSIVTPEGTPAAIAATFARWRLLLRGPVSRPNRRGEQVPTSNETPSTKIRVDRGMEPMNEAVLGPEWDQPQVQDRMMIGTAIIGAMVPPDQLATLDEAMQRSAGAFELMLPTAERRYVFAFDVRSAQLADRIDQFEADVQRRVAQARIQWSEPHEVPVDQHRLITRLMELTVRETLSDQNAKGMVADPDEMRPGLPSLDTAIATARLDEEIRRLGVRMKTRSLQLKSAAQRSKR